MYSSKVIINIISNKNNDKYNTSVSRPHGGGVPELVAWGPHK